MSLDARLGHPLADLLKKIKPAVSYHAARPAFAGKLIVGPDPLRSDHEAAAKSAARRAYFESARMTASGSRAITRNRTLAGPLSVRWPCS